MGLMDSMGTLGSELSSLASNPLVDAAVGAGIGALASHRRNRATGAAVGAGLGMEAGSKLGEQKSRDAEMAQRAQYQKVLMDQANQAMKIGALDLKAKQAFWDLDPATRAKYGNNQDVYNQVIKEQQLDQIHLPAVRGMLQTALSQPPGQKYFGAYGIKGPNDLASLDLNQATSILDGYQKYIGESMSPQVGLEQERLNAEKAHYAADEAAAGTSNKIAQEHIDIDRANEPLVQVQDPAHPGQYIYRERKDAVGAGAPPPASTTGLVVTMGEDGKPVYTPKAEAAGKAAPPKSTESPDKQAQTEASTVKAIVDSYAKSHGARPGVVGGVTGSRDAWDKGLESEFIAKGYDPKTHAKIPAGYRVKYDGAWHEMGKDGQWHPA